MVVIMGVANAAAIIIGKAIGAGKTKQAEEYGRRFMKMTVILGIAGGCLILALTPAVLSFMKLGAESMSYLRYMMLIMSFFVFFSSLNSVLIVGLFRAGGDTRFGLVIDAGSMWCVAVVLGMLAAFVWRLPVVAVYVLLLSDEIVKTPFSVWRYASKRWLNDVTR
jgi:Na+-driven multidrug efflux pump